VKIDPIWTAAGQQQVYREVLECMARPGRLGAIDEALTEAPATLAVIATLVDDAVTFADPGGLLSDAARAPLDFRPEGDACADYVLLDGALPPAVSPRLGSLVAPESSTTLLVQVAGLDQGTALYLSGPGIKDEARLYVDGLHPDWLSARARWVGTFPRGVDLILFTANRFVALPRTTRIMGVH